MTIALALIILVALLLVGIPVAYSFLASTAFLVIIQGYDPSFLLPYGYGKLGSMALLAVPMFIIAGNLMNEGKIGDKLIDFVDLFVGQIKGGLGVVTIITCAIFGSITGSAFATATCIGSIMEPKLRKSGYPVGYIGALLANSAILGLLIPPSTIMILYCWIGRQSVLAAFLAIVAPGIMMTTLLAIFNVLVMRKNTDAVMSEKMTAREFPKRFCKIGFKAIPAFFLPIIMLGGIYSGIMTPTEAAAVGALYSIPVGFWIYKGLKWDNFKKCLINSAVSTGSIFVMLFAVMLLSRLYITENVPQTVFEILTNISTNKNVLLLMINIFMVILGMLMDDASACLLATPILLPVAIKIGVDPTHFAAILAVNLGMGNVTPPTAPLLFVGGHLSGARMDQMIGYALKMIAFAWLPTLFVTTYFPGFSMWLPNLILK